MYLISLTKVERTKFMKNRWNFA